MGSKPSAPPNQKTIVSNNMTDCLVNQPIETVKMDSKQQKSPSVLMNKNKQDPNLKNFDSNSASQSNPNQSLTNQQNKAKSNLAQKLNNTKNTQMKKQLNTNSSPIKLYTNLQIPNQSIPTQQKAQANSVNIQQQNIPINPKNSHSLAFLNKENSSLIAELKRLDRKLQNQMYYIMKQKEQENIKIQVNSEISQELKTQFNEAYCKLDKLKKKIEYSRLKDYSTENSQFKFQTLSNKIAQLEQIISKKEVQIQTISNVNQHQQTTIKIEISDLLLDKVEQLKLQQQNLTQKLKCLKNNAKKQVQEDKIQQAYLIALQQKIRMMQSKQYQQKLQEKKLAQSRILKQYEQHVYNQQTRTQEFKQMKEEIIKLKQKKTQKWGQMQKLYEQIKLQRKDKHAITLSISQKDAQLLALEKQYNKLQKRTLISKSVDIFRLAPRKVLQQNKDFLNNSSMVTLKNQSDASQSVILPNINNNSKSQLSKYKHNYVNKIQTENSVPNRSWNIPNNQKDSKVTEK